MSRISSAKWFGLAALLASVTTTALVLPAQAQDRVCVETDNGRVVCGRRVSDRYDRDRYNNDRYDRDRSDNSSSSFDEEFYLAAYPDVAAAVRNRNISSAYDHYRKFGRYEGRLPRFNEASYLSKNPDVADAVRRGKIRSGYQHWLRFGRYENRKV